MASSTVPPFSARNRRDIAPVDDAFPATARVGLLHLVSEGIRKDYLEGWAGTALELQRIARVPPQTYTRPDSSAARENAEAILNTLPWEKVYDFCERLHNSLAKEAGYRGDMDNYVVTTSKSEVQLFFSNELQRLFQEENLAFEFRDGLVQRRGRRHTVDQVSKAETALVDTRLATARKHFAKALRYFRDRVKPDPENAVKEAVCAVEAAAKDLFPNAKATTLGDATKWLTGPEPGKLPKAIGQTFTGLYAFRSGGDGVGHGGSTGGTATTSIAEYVLALAASQIILLVDLANAEEDEIPF
jgi:AbiJ N-terminal domain 4